MGCDIHAHVERRDTDGQWQHVEWPLKHDEWTDGPFDWRSYYLFGFLAGVRATDMPMIAEPKQAIPVDASEQTRKSYEGWGYDAHTATWLDVGQLAAFDYDTVCSDGTLRELLGPTFFDDLAVLMAMNTEAPTRVVFWFDS